MFRLLGFCLLGFGFVVVILRLGLVVVMLWVARLMFVASLYWGFGFELVFGWFGCLSGCCVWLGCGSFDWRVV